MSVHLLCKTRGGRPALVMPLQLPVADFVYTGRIDDRDLELWRADGAWREDGSPHPLDLVLNPPDVLKKILPHNP